MSNEELNGVFECYDCGYKPMSFEAAEEHENETGHTELVFVEDED